MLKRVSVLSLFALLGCIREAPQNSPQVRPETTQAAAHPAPAQPTPPAPAAHVEAPGGGCGHAAAEQPAPAHAGQTLGAPITVADATALSAIVQNPSRYSGQTIRTEGVVTAVCQAAGCWMQISDAEQRVHVKMHGHAFFIPRNASGRRARVQGTVVGGNPNGHCEQEAAEATGQQAAQRLEIDATGVELL